VARVRHSSWRHQTRRPTRVYTFFALQANRDLLDYRFLYRLTSEFLRAENTDQPDQARALDAARVRAVKAAQRFDTPLYKQVGEAESRLGGLLALQMQGKPPTAKAVVQAAGASPPVRVLMRDARRGAARRERSLRLRRMRACVRESPIAHARHGVVACGVVLVVARRARQAIFAFWLVLLAAICAWESKLDVASVVAQARSKIADLTGDLT
jgi:hypothetical protein